MLAAQHGLFGCEVTLVSGALHQHHASRYVPGREHVRGARPEGVVYPDVATLGFHARGLEVQPLHVAGPADREHYGFCIESAPLAVLAIVETEVPLSFLYALYTADAGDDLDPSPPERLGYPLRHRLILRCEDARPSI